LGSPQEASLTASKTPSAVFRRASFTMRQRLTPAKACSTRTRTRPNFRLVRCSAALNSPPAGFFSPGWSSSPRLVLVEAAISAATQDHTLEAAAGRAAKATLGMVGSIVGGIQGKQEKEARVARLRPSSRDITNEPEKGVAGRIGDRVDFLGRGIKNDASYFKNFTVLQLSSFARTPLDVPNLRPATMPFYQVGVELSRNHWQLVRL